MIEGITLSELNHRIKAELQIAFPDEYWVIGEISDMHINATGHCYMEMVEKAEESDRIIARIRANIWAFTFRMIKPYFESVTGSRLSAGQKILFRAKIEYHPVYGMSLNVKDINPEFTLGDIAKKKREIIQRLEKEGIIDMNKMLDFPMVPQRIAVISSETAAGYGDFTKSLSEQKDNFTFHITLFPASMQGEKTEESIISALDDIFKNEKMFDLVVIIRGGGAQADLESFNNYNLAFHIAQFPLPVLTGIGHERDESVTDLVAFKSLKTPTGVAAYIVEYMFNFYAYVEDLGERLYDLCNGYLNNESQFLREKSMQLKSIAEKRVSREKEIQESFQKTLKTLTKYKINRLKEALTYQRSRFINNSLSMVKYKYEDLSNYHRGLIKESGNFIQRSKEKLVSFEKIKIMLDPSGVLKRGFSITSFNGKILKDTKEIKQGDEIETILSSGKIISKIQKKSNNG